MKKLLLATALTSVMAIAAPAAHAATDEDIRNLQGWQEDLDFINSHRQDSNPAVRNCVTEVDDDMEANRGAITLGFPGVKIFLPAANHYRENTIMPWFHNCVDQARS